MRRRYKTCPEHPEHGDMFPAGDDGTFVFVKTKWRFISNRLLKVYLKELKEKEDEKNER